MTQGSGERAQREAAFLATIEPGIAQMERLLPVGLDVRETVTGVVGHAFTLPESQAEALLRLVGAKLNAVGHALLNQKIDEAGAALERLGKLRPERN